MTPVKTCRLLLFIYFLARSVNAQQIPDHEPRMVDVREAMDRGIAYLVRHQYRDGSFPADRVLTHPIGVTSWVAISLMETGFAPTAPPVQRALGYLRSVPGNQPVQTHEIALLLLALEIADSPADRPRIAELTLRLTSLQRSSGGWGSLPGDLEADPGLTALALFALRGAAQLGIPVEQGVWSRGRAYFQNRQNADGSWGEPPIQSPLRDEDFSQVGATIRAISCLTLCDQMLAQQNPRGDCEHCGQSRSAEDPQARGLRWLRDRKSQPSSDGDARRAVAYYLHGLENSQRLSGALFADESDWLQSGLRQILERQDRATGAWPSNNESISTSQALLFLSKTVTPVLINKLRHGPRENADGRELLDDDWNCHAGDVGTLADMLAGRPGWPTRLTTQEVDLAGRDSVSARNVLEQAPLVVITGSRAPVLSPAEVDALRRYVQGGGFVLGMPSCTVDEFESGFRQLAEEIGGGPLSPLTTDHPVYHADTDIGGEAITLQGVETGCRTAVLYCPEDLGGAWNRLTRHTLMESSSPEFATRQRALRIGANIAAYASGRQPANRVEVRQRILDRDRPQTPASRDVLRIALLQHEGDWNTAPGMLATLCKLVGETTGIAATAHSLALRPNNARLFDHGLLFMHGQRSFKLTDEERLNLRLHLDRGGVLFADACCADRPFDRSFRELARQLYPRHTLKPIPTDHEIYSKSTGHPLTSVRIRTREAKQNGESERFTIQETRPALEGIEWEGRLVVIYSRLDVSCALDHLTESNCEGYVAEDAARLATNVVCYAVLHNLRLPPME